MDPSVLAGLSIVGGLAGLGTIVGLLVHLHNKHVALLRESVEGLRQNSVVEAQKVIVALKEFHKVELETLKTQHARELSAARAEFEADRAKLWAEFQEAESQLKKLNDPQAAPVLRRLTISGTQVFGKTRDYARKWSGQE